MTMSEIRSSLGQEHVLSHRERIIQFIQRSDKLQSLMIQHLVDGLAEGKIKDEKEAWASLQETFKFNPDTGRKFEPWQVADAGSEALTVFNEARQLAPDDLRSLASEKMPDQKAA